LLRAGAPYGSQGDTNASWPSQTYATATYGGSTSRWGGAWTAADVFSSNFGFRLVAYNASTLTPSGWVDYMAMRVTFCH
jgi:hypothetical protein